MTKSSDDLPEENFIVPLVRWWDSSCPRERTHSHEQTHTSPFRINRIFTDTCGRDRLPFSRIDYVQGSNPFDLVVGGDQIYVTDGGQNSVWQVDIATGTFSTLATFPKVANPLFNPTPPPFLGPPMIDAVSTGIAYSDGQLLVTLFRGFPFPAEHFGRGTG